MIIRRLTSALQLITQPDRAALSARIMRLWHRVHFPDSARKASILHAIEEHDAGWAEIDASVTRDQRIAHGRLGKGQVQGPAG